MLGLEIRLGWCASAFHLFIMSGTGCLRAMSMTSGLACNQLNSTSFRAATLRQYIEVRAYSLKLAAPLSTEDQCIQSMPEASPTKWHLAHTTWFFEAMVLHTYQSDYRVFDERYFYLFNSYYETLGPRHPRPQRGLLSRPALSEIHAYRRHVDAAIQSLIESCADLQWQAIRSLLILGLNHEQQHQELLLTDILHALWCNPLRPAYQAEGPEYSSSAPSLGRPVSDTTVAFSDWLALPGGIVPIGCDEQGEDGFYFDNESPRHKVLLQPYELGTRLVTCGEYAQFVADGGYRHASLWLSDGWAALQAQGWQAPLYWVQADNTSSQTANWQVFGLKGLCAFIPTAPVTNLNFYEASAYAEWAGARLPTEFEWEAGAKDARMTEAIGYAWQWTRSSYDPYPRFHPAGGAVGEYNGKFMVGQLVLRGSSFATPAGHTRVTYRNFFPPGARWQFSGLRLAKDSIC